MSSEAIPEPVEARPWRPEDGPEPDVTTWPSGSRPALSVWSRGAWRHAPVTARQVWADGRVFYQVTVDLRGNLAVSARTYEWPQPGLRVAERPSAAVGGEKPIRPPASGKGPGRRPATGP
ncbi:hypothetical protein ACWGH2_41955 [Streptomyces sp. NPDC054871]